VAADPGLGLVGALPRLPAGVPLAFAFPAMTGLADAEVGEAKFGEAEVGEFGEAEVGEFGEAEVGEAKFGEAKFGEGVLVPLDLFALVTARATAASTTATAVTITSSGQGPLPERRLRAGRSSPCPPCVWVLGGPPAEKRGSSAG